METAFFVLGFFGIGLAMLTVFLFVVYILFASDQDLEEAGVHLDRNTVPLPDSVSLDVFVSQVFDTCNASNTPEEELRAYLGRALTIIVNARDIMDDLPDSMLFHNPDLENRVNNWLVRGHQD